VDSFQPHHVNLGGSTPMDSSWVPTKQRRISLSSSTSRGRRDHHITRHGKTRCEARPRLGQTAKRM